MKYQIFVILRIALIFFAGALCMIFIQAVIYEGKGVLTVLSAVEEVTVKLIAAFGALATAVTPIVLGFIAWKKQSEGGVIERTREIANDPKSPRAPEAQQALRDATASLPVI